MNTIKDMNNDELYQLYKDINQYLEYLQKELEKMMPKE